jgi:hypothetical protein
MGRLTPAGPSVVGILTNFTVKPFLTRDHFAYTFRVMLIVAESAAPSTQRQSIWFDVLAHDEGGAVVDASVASGGLDPGALGVTMTAVATAAHEITFSVVLPGGAPALRCVGEIQWAEVRCSP